MAECMSLKVKFKPLHCLLCFKTLGKLHDLSETQFSLYNVGIRLYFTETF
jgi:hypothetical protein